MTQTPHTSLSVTLVQINPIVGDLAYNRDKIMRVWEEHDAASDLIVFPELALCGYPPEDLVLKPDFLDQTESCISDIVAKSTSFSAAALVGCAWRGDGQDSRKAYNAVHLIYDGKIQETRYKHHLPNYGVFDEQRIFAAGPLPAPMPFKGTSLGVMICEDMWFPDVAAHLKTQGAHALVIPNASPFETEKYDIRAHHARSRAAETGLPVFYVNQIGGQDELVFDGRSFVMNPDGSLAAQAVSFAEDTLHIEDMLGRPAAHTQTRTQPRSADRDLADIYSALKLGLSDYVTKNNFSGVLLGLSGGIDSALVAVIAADALGPARVHAVMMPSRYTSEESLEDAAALADNLGIRLDNVPIENAVDAFREALKKPLQDIKPVPAVTFENIQSRTRGLLLMALSNATGRMVLSTGNKSEMAIGYATLYGDMNGGFNPLKDIYKTQVYALSRWRNAQDSVIPERILTKAPTAELREGQTDQDTLPPYEELDAILGDLIEREEKISDIPAKGYDVETVRRVWAMLDRAEYKRRQAPPGIKITARAFGRDRRYPITNGFKG